MAFDRAFKKRWRSSWPEAWPYEPKQAPILLEAQAMLHRWEQGEAEVVELWSTMNNWVYDGFGKTYTEMGVDFDKLYYESTPTCSEKTKWLQVWSLVCFSKRTTAAFDDLMTRVWTKTAPARTNRLHDAGHRNRHPPVQRFPAWNAKSTQ